MSIARSLISAQGERDLGVRVFGTSLLIYDLSIPTSPLFVGQASIPEASDDIILDPDSDIVYVATNNAIYAYDINDENNPVQIGSSSSFPNLTGLCFDANNKYLYGVDVTSSRLEVIDFTNVASPTFVAADNNIDASGSGRKGLISIGHNLGAAFVAARDGSSLNIYAFDLASPLSLLGTISRTTSSSFDPSIALDTQNNILYVGILTFDGLGLYSFDVSDPTSMSFLGLSVTDFSSILGLDVSNNVLYGTRIASGFTLETVSVDVSNPSSPVVLDSISPIGRSVDLKNKIIYGDSDIIDISNPSSLSVASAGSPFIDVITTNLDGSNSPTNSYS